MSRIVTDGLGFTLRRFSLGVLLTFLFVCIFALTEVRPAHAEMSAAEVADYVAVYQVYNQNGQYKSQWLYSTDKARIDRLVADDGWDYEGVAWY